MLPGRHTSRAHHIAALGSLLLAMLFAPLAAAQSEPARTITPQQAIEMFNQVQAWVEAGTTPLTDRDDDAGPLAAGVVVTIRLDGRIVGRGISLDPDPRTGHAGQAAAQAIRAARTQLEAAGEKPRLTVSLEIAPELVPLRLAEGEQLALRLSPGLDGLALRRGDQTAAWFPSQIRERNSLPSNVLGPLVTLLGGARTETLLPAVDLQEAGYTIYRVRPMHLAMPLPGMSPVFLHRGGRVVGLHAVSQAGLREAAQGLATHLMGLEWNGPEAFGLGGSLDPLTGTRSTPFATPIVQSSAALALLRASGVAGLDPATAERARASGEQLLRELSSVIKNEQEPWADESDAAMTVIALAELRPQRLQADPALVELRDRCLERVRSVFVPGSGIGTGFVELGSGQIGLLAFALVRDAAHFGGSAAVADEAVRAVYRDTPQGVLVAQMPWLGWASVELAELNGTEIAAASPLREMRDLVSRFRLWSTDLDHSERDLAGGIVFTRGTTPLPTWQSLRPLAFLATMLGEPELTIVSDERNEKTAELAAMLESLRYVLQLCAGVEESHLYRSPGLARWGVRSSLWDQSMPTEASVLALLTICETLEALEAPRDPS